MIDNSLKQRRRLLIKSLIVTASALAGTACGFKSTPSIEEVMQTAIRLLRHPKLAANIGRQYLQQYTDAGRLTSEQLITRILAGTAIDTGKPTSSSLFNLGQELTNKVRTDFSQENIVKVEGWLLSETEAQLCALLASTSNL